MLWTPVAPLAGGSAVAAVMGGAPPAVMSLVLTAASSQYLSRTWGSAPTSNKTFTLSLWFKRLSTGNASATPFYDGGAWNASTSESQIRINTTDKLEAFLWDGTTLLGDLLGNTAVADITTWHNCCYTVDTTPNPATMKFFLDGIEGYQSTALPAQNQNMHMTDNGLTSAIGRDQESAARYLDSKLAYMYFIDGQQLTPSSFTTGTGVGTIHPIAYTGTFGTNGFFLNFSNSNTNDQSGNGNNWTQNNGPTFSADVPT